MKGDLLIGVLLSSLSNHTHSWRDVGSEAMTALRRRATCGYTSPVGRGRISSVARNSGEGLWSHVSAAPPHPKFAAANFDLSPLGRGETEPVRRPIQSKTVMLQPSSVIGPTISTSLRAQRSNPSIHPRKERMDCFVALLLAMTMWRVCALRDRNVTARRANHSRAQKPVQPPRQKYFAFSEAQISRSVRVIPLSSEGRFANVTDVERAAVDAMATQDGRR